MREEKGRVGVSKGSRWQGRMSKMVWLLEEKRVTYHDVVTVYDGVEPVRDLVITLQSLNLSGIVLWISSSVLWWEMQNSDLKNNTELESLNQDGPTTASPLVKHTLLQAQSPWAVPGVDVGCGLIDDENAVLP